MKIRNILACCAAALLASTAIAQQPANCNPDCAVVLNTPMTYPPSGSASIQVTVTNGSGAAQVAGVMDLEMHNPDGTRVANTTAAPNACCTSAPIPALAAGASTTLTMSWPLPTAAAAYTIQAGVFQGNWAKDLTWNNTAGVINVVAPPPPPPALTLDYHVTFTCVAGAPMPTVAVVNNLYTLHVNDGCYLQGAAHD